MQNTNLNMILNTMKATEQLTSMTIMEILTILTVIMYASIIQ